MGVFIRSVFICKSVYLFLCVCVYVRVCYFSVRQANARTSVNSLQLKH